MSAESDLREQIASHSRDPLGFVKFVYRWRQEGELSDSRGPHAWQQEALESIGRHLRSANRFTPFLLAVASGHGIGKTALVSFITHWAMSTCDDCRVVITANTGDQLTTKTVPEVSIWFRRALNVHWWKVGTESIKATEAAHEKTWRTDFLTWSLERTEAFAGLHNKGKRIVLIFDEASAIPDKIWEVAEGALTDEHTEIIWIAFGNPTQNTGRFRECFGKYKHRWKTRQIDSRTVDGTNKAQLEKWISDYGEDSDFCRVRVRGEFPRAGSTQFVAGDIVAQARIREVGDQSKAYKILSVDVARFGDDQTVIGYRQGLYSAILDRIRGMDTIQVGRQVIMRIIQEVPRSIVIDGDGIGGGVTDYVRTYLPEIWQGAGLPHTVVRGEIKLPEWFRIEEFHGGASPGDQFMYFNKRAEVWGRMRDWLCTGQIPDDPELAADLTGPEYYHSSKNQIQLEKKEDMKKRGLASPDCGDMLAMTFGGTPIPKTREEALREDIQNTPDPLERHFKKLRETERREKANQPLPYWS